MAATLDETFSIEEFLAAEEAKDLLRFSTAGSVDDGKSTLIGRLLYDSRNVYEDQVRAVTGKQAGPNGGQSEPAIDFALLTDGLRAEREQGITIDVAYRYFATARRKFIIADTPGHEQYTRNMATGASTADLAIVLIDASDTVLHANASARQLFPACATGVAAQAALRHADLPVGWWRVAEGAAMPRELRIEGQTHRGYVSCRRSRMNPEPTTVVVLE